MGKLFSWKCTKKTTATGRRAKSQEGEATCNEAEKEAIGKEKTCTCIEKDADYRISEKYML